MALTADRVLKLRIVGDAAGFGKASDQASKKLDGWRGTWQRWQRHAQIAGAAVTLAIGKFAVDSVKAYAEAQAAQQQLQDAFDRFPQLADLNIEALRGLNTELAKKTRFDDDALASGEAVLAQFVDSGEQLKELTPLLADYAAKTGRDLPAAAKVFGKAFLGNTRALKDLGINYVLTGDRATDMANITELVRQKVGGFAEKEGKTAAGQLAILKNRFGELQESVGEKLLPVLTALLGFLSGALGFIEKIPAPLRDAAIAVTLLSAAALVAGPRIAAMSVAMKEAGISATGAAGKLGALAVIAVGATQTVNGLKESWDNWNSGQSVGHKLLNQLAIDVNTITFGLVDFRDKTDDAAGATGDAQKITDQMAAAEKDFAAKTANATQKINDQETSIEEWADTAFDAYNQVIGLRGAENTFEQAIDDATQAVKDNGKTLDVHTAKGRANREALDNLATSTLDLVADQIKNHASQKTLNGTLDRGRDKFIKIAEKMGLTKQQAKDLADQLGLTRTALNELPTEKTIKVKMDFHAGGPGVDAFVAVSTAGGFGGRALLGRQHGGPVSAGRAYLVGERAPELFIPNQSGQVVPIGAPQTGDVDVRVFIGDEELKGIVRTEVSRRDRATKRRALAGVR